MKAHCVLLLVIALLALPVSLWAAPAAGGDFTLSGAAVTGGGASQGGAFALNGTAGEPATGEVAGGEFTLSGGLIGVYVVPGEVALTLTQKDFGEATLTWPAATGHVLEFTAAVGPGANWQPVTPAPPGNTFTTPINQPARFFRLRRP